MQVGGQFVQHCVNTHYTVELGRYRYSVFLKYWLKIANFWYVIPLCGAPVEGDGNFTVFWKIRLMGPRHQAMKKFDKFGRFDTST